MDYKENLKRPQIIQILNTPTSLYTFSFSPHSFFHSCNPALCAGLVTGGFVNILGALKRALCRWWRVKTTKKSDSSCMGKASLHKVDFIHRNWLCLSGARPLYVADFLSFLRQSNADITWNSPQWLVSKDPGVRLSRLELLGTWRTKSKRWIGSQKNKKDLSVQNSGSHNLLPC